MFEKPVCSPGSPSERSAEMSLLKKAQHAIFEFYNCFSHTTVMHNCVYIDIEIKYFQAAVNQKFVQVSRDALLFPLNIFENLSVPQRPTKSEERENYRESSCDLAQQYCEKDVQIIQEQVQVQTDGNISRKSQMRGGNMSLPRKDDAIKLWQYRERWEVETDGQRLK